MSRHSQLVLLTMLAGSLAVVIIGLDFRRQVLRDKIIVLQAQKDTAFQRTAENKQDRETGQNGKAGVQPSLELQKLRDQVAALEAQARNQRTKMLARSVRRMAEAAGFGNENRDPQQGMAKIEYFQNVGCSTPAAALQTLVWAALNGNDAILEPGLTLDDKAREKAELLRSRLPEDGRDQATPEKIAALWFQSTVLDIPALQIIAQMVIDDSHVTLLLRGGIGDGQTLNLQHGPAGWRIIVPERGIEAMLEKILGASPG